MELTREQAIRTVLFALMAQNKFLFPDRKEKEIPYWIIFNLKVLGVTQQEIDDAVN
jgi:hypothetical protein